MSLTPSDTRTLLASLGHTPKKKLGQNFLIDKNIVQKSLDLANPSKNTPVVEIGPGLGTLTAAMLERGLTVYAVEKDPTLHQHLKETLLPKFPNTLHLTLADALDEPLAKLPASTQNYRIIANLPYAISTPWLDAVLSSPTLPQSFTLMLQKETADRFTAPCHTKHFSPISIFLAATFEPTHSHNVSPKCFYPAPAVGSALLHLEQLDNPHSFPKSTKSLIRNIFTQRRKQIQALAKQYPIPTDWLNFLEKNNIPLNTRPQSIPLEYWVKLDSFLVPS